MFSCAHLACLIVICSFSMAELTRPRGVSISMATFYRYNTADPVFHCLDKSNKIPYEYVNDDYCDCVDGSDEPGTSACPNGKYHCTNAGHSPLNILSSRVNDGICDCCDGSDEYHEIIHCSNNCKELGKLAREEAEKEKKLVEEGYKTRQSYSEDGQKAIEEKKVLIVEYEKELELAKVVKEEAEAHKNEAERPEKDAKDLHQQLWDAEKEKRDKVADELKCTEAFRELDVSQDGIIDVEEMTLHKEFDVDNNSIVSEEEAKEYMSEQFEATMDHFVAKMWPSMKDIYKPLSKRVPEVVPEVPVPTPPAPRSPPPPGAMPYDDEEDYRDDYDDKHDDDDDDDDDDDVNDRADESEEDDYRTPVETRTEDDRKDIKGVGNERVLNGDGVGKYGEATQVKDCHANEGNCGSQAKIADEATDQDQQNRDGKGGSQAKSDNQATDRDQQNHDGDGQVMQDDDDSGTSKEGKDHANKDDDDGDDGTRNERKDNINKDDDDDDDSETSKERRGDVNKVDDNQGSKDNEGNEEDYGEGKHADVDEEYEDEGNQDDIDEGQEGHKDKDDEGYEEDVDETNDDSDEDDDDDGSDDDDDRDDDDGGGSDDHTKESKKGDDDKTDDDMPEYDENTKQLIEKANEARTAFTTAEKEVTRIEKEIGEINNFLSLDLGENKEFFPLKDNCYELDDKEYTYVLCPFKRASQKSRSTGGHDTPLGSWGKWSGPDNDKYSTMLFEKGQNCWNGPDRSVTVSLKCGVENRLTSASEPSRCEYHFTFITPARCSQPPNAGHSPHTEL